MKYATLFHLLIIVMLASVLSLSGCGVEDGTDGTDGTPGAPGAPGVPGDTGAQGPPTGSGIDLGVTTFHGKNHLESTGEFATTETNPKYYATVAITSATAAVDGTVVVDFTVADGNDDPVIGLTSGISYNIAKLVPASGGENFNQWVPYVYGSQTVSGSATGDWPNPDGTAADQGSRENSGLLTDNGDGSYSYEFTTNLTVVTTPVTAQAITYDRSLTHRVSVMMGGHSGPTADANYDFVPDGTAITETRDIVETAVCKSCHGDEFHGHGGDRVSSENCVTCHNPSTTDPHSGETVDFKVMIHKIHAGGELATIPGVDGIVWDDPDTPTDESADNGEYAIWGYRQAKHEWWKAGFPAIIDNCTKCHQETVPSTLAEVDNWKDVPSRAACGSCHDDVDFALGTNHSGGIQLNDSNCAGCHQPDGTGSASPQSVTYAHDWTQHDIRNIPEFTVDLTVSPPGNGTHFVDGENPVVSIEITPQGSGTPIDHTLANKDTDGKEGCDNTADPLVCAIARDGLFDHIYLMVHGPRAERNPVLTTAARADVVSSTAGTFDLSTAVDLQLKVDNGQDLYSTDNGGTVKPGSITVDVADGTFVSIVAATPTEIVDWLNADTDFASRAIAYLDNGFVAIRSRNLGKFYAIQLEASDVNTLVFGNDQSIYTVGGYYPRNEVAEQVSGTDPKASYSSASIDYTLDPVDDLKPGTYIASVEITDAGRIDDTNYRTPSVAKTLFQVKQATEELAPAGNCGSCHQGPQGTGFVLDYPRHNKIFDNTAIDQCGGCHDYQNGKATGEWYGALTINKRVHAVHNGANLVYPNLTVGYIDGIAGRNWEIVFPQDILNCETCHAPATTSGSWKTKAARNPCSGCHDSDAASAHFKLMTYDPTPTNPFNGDEEESCQVCH